MKRVLVAACTATMFFLPTPAQGASPYVAFQAGVLRGKDNDVDEFADYQTAQSPATPSVPAAAVDQEYDDVFRINYGKGYDFGLIGGYDFGWIRLEVEVSHKNSGLRHIDADDNAGSTLSSLNSALNRPSQAPDPGAPARPALTIEDFDLDGEIDVTSVMANAMLDIGVTKRLSAFFGYGYGRSWVKALMDDDTAWSWQRFYGVRYKISDRVELGVKYRKLNSGVVKLHDEPLLFGGNPDRLMVTTPLGGSLLVDQTTNAVVVPEIEGAFRTHSFLASLIYNF